MRFNLINTTESIHTCYLCIQLFSLLLFFATAFLCSCPDLTLSEFNLLFSLLQCQLLKLLRLKVVLPDGKEPSAEARDSLRTFGRILFMKPALALRPQERLQQFHRLLVDSVLTKAHETLFQVEVGPKDVPATLLVAVLPKRHVGPPRDFQVGHQLDRFEFEPKADGDGVEGEPGDVGGVGYAPDLVEAHAVDVVERSFHPLLNLQQLLAVLSL